jgi:hypothetical protein
VTQPKERKFGAIPDDKSRGPISPDNYEWRAEAHCAAKSAERNGEHPTLNLDSPSLPVWQEYFERHLGGWPHCFWLLMEKRIKEMTLPAGMPQWFDGTFSPTPGWRPFARATERLTALRPERLGDRPSTAKYIEHQPTTVELAEEVLRRYRQAAIAADERIANAANRAPEAHREP